MLGAQELRCEVAARVIEDCQEGKKADPELMYSQKAHFEPHDNHRHDRLSADLI